MGELKDLFQSADWKKEKHVPVIEAPGAIKKGEPLLVRVSVGKEIPHPNTTEHHIRWIAVYFQPNDDKFPYEIAKFEFSSHGESVQGPNTSTLYTSPDVSFMFKSEKAGRLFASSYCNIHGLWQNSRELSLD